MKPKALTIPKYGASLRQPLRLKIDYTLTIPTDKREDIQGRAFCTAITQEQPIVDLLHGQTAHALIE